MKGRNLWVPLSAIALMAFGAILLVALLVSSSNLAQRNCENSTNYWSAFQRVITATENPPSLAGKPITQDQRDALQAYGEHLRAAVGDKPTC